jgi:hypothetical protein
VPTELVLLGMIAIIFLIIFFFLYLELSTRKRRLVQDTKIILIDLPFKLSVHKKEEQSKLSSISELLKLVLDGEVRSMYTENEFLNQSSYTQDEISRHYSDKAPLIIREVIKLGNKVAWLDALSIGELERILTTIENYYNSELPKSDVDIKSALSRANSILDHFIPMYSPKGNTRVQG